MISALDVAQRFFTYYQNRDVEGMLTCFAPGGQIDYLPIGLRGAADDAGRQVWGALLDVFPDLSNQVTATHLEQSGHVVVVEVTISGTQSKDAFGIQNQGRRYELPHVFIICTDEAQRITLMKAYWDNAAWYLALGRTSLTDA